MMAMRFTFAVMARSRGLHGHSAGSVRAHGVISLIETV